MGWSCSPEWAPPGPDVPEDAALGIIFVFSGAFGPGTGKAQQLLQKKKQSFAYPSLTVWLWSTQCREQATRRRADGRRGATATRRPDRARGQRRERATRRRADGRRGRPCEDDPPRGDRIERVCEQRPGRSTDPPRGDRIERGLGRNAPPLPSSPYSSSGPSPLLVDASPPASRRLSIQRRAVRHSDGASPVDLRSEQQRRRARQLFRRSVRSAYPWSLAPPSLLAVVMLTSTATATSSLFYQVLPNKQSTHTAVIPTILLGRRPCFSIQVQLATLPSSLVCIECEGE